jgi:hypothetical protein
MFFIENPVRKSILAQNKFVRDPRSLVKEPESCAAAQPGASHPDPATMNMAMNAAAQAAAAAAAASSHRHAAACGLWTACGVRPTPCFVPAAVAVDMGGTGAAGDVPAHLMTEGWPRPIRRCCCCMSLRRGWLVGSCLYALLDLAVVTTAAWGTDHRLATPSAGASTPPPHPSTL